MATRRRGAPRPLKFDRCIASRTRPPRGSWRGPSWRSRWPTAAGSLPLSEARRRSAGSCPPGRGHAASGLLLLDQAAKQQAQRAGPGSTWSATMQQPAAAACPSGQGRQALTSLLDSDEASCASLSGLVV